MASNLNPANAVTASRFLTLPPFVWAVDRGYHQTAMLLLLLCGVLDLFDGLCYGFAIIVLTAYGRVPWAPVAIILALGLLNAGLRWVYARRAGRTTNYQSHAMERLVAFAAYLGGFGTLGFQVTFYFWTFVALLAVVVAHDAKRMVLDPVAAEVA
jgi:phosphatidylglycerophosphate synthase